MVFPAFAYCATGAPVAVPDIGLLAKLPIIGILFSLVGAIVGLYAFVGIVLSILVFVKVLK